MVKNSHKYYVTVFPKLFCLFHFFTLFLSNHQLLIIPAIRYIKEVIVKRVNISWPKPNIYSFFIIPAKEKKCGTHPIKKLINDTSLIIQTSLGQQFSWNSGQPHQSLLPFSLLKCFFTKLFVVCLCQWLQSIFFKKKKHLKTYAVPTEVLYNLLLFWKLNILNGSNNQLVDINIQ